MDTTKLNLLKLPLLGASLLLTGMLSGGLVLANESGSGSTTGSSHSTTSGSDTSSHGGMRMDCPDDLKEGDECPEGWEPEGSQQDMPGQGSGSSGGMGSGGSSGGSGSSGSSGGMGTGGTTGGSTGGGSGTSGGTGTSQ